MGRIVAIDYGRKRVGVAATDTLQMIAGALETVHSKDIIEFLVDYCSKEPVDTIVVGYPKQMDNTPSESVRFIDPFIKKLRKIFRDITIDIEDERFTSSMALQTMIDGGVKKQKRRDKGMIDKISATIILQSYMDRKKNTNK